MDELIFRPETDNIFEFSFMDDFTTVDLVSEEYAIETTNPECKDDFYCFSENKFYTAEELYRKFNIKVSENC